MKTAPPTGRTNSGTCDRLTITGPQSLHPTVGPYGQPSTVQGVSAVELFFLLCIAFGMALLAIVAFAGMRG